MPSRKHRIEVHGKDIPADEPLFLLRAQDTLAPGIVKAYALAVEELADAAGTKEERDRLLAQASDVLAVSIEMQGWQLENAERVKNPD
jgi:hypothetical protein